jgi:probable phosphoglycerate mutase
MKLILVRHGDPDYAKDSLTPKGVEQAKLLSDKMVNVNIDEIFVSPMGRAKLTAEYTINEKPQVPFKILNWLHELNGNYKDHLWAWNDHGCDSLKEADKFTPGNWSSFIEYGPHVHKMADEFYFSFAAFMKEQGYVLNGNLYKIQKSNDKTIAFFCHAGVILTLLAHLLHVPIPVVYAQFAIDPSSATTLETEEKDGFCVFRLISLNDMSHAESLRSSVQQAGTFPE